MRNLRCITSIIFIMVMFLVTEKIYPQGVEFSFHGGKASRIHANGIGGSVTINLPTGIKTIHAGARITYHLPSRNLSMSEINIDGSMVTVDGENSLFLYGVEGGITVLSSPLMIRAVMGVGRAQHFEEFMVSENDTMTKTTRKLNTHYIQPGVVVGMPLGIAIIGVEARYTRLEKGYSMPAIYGLVGFKFGL